MKNVKKGCLHTFTSLVSMSSCLVFVDILNQTYGFKPANIDVWSMRKTSQQFDKGNSLSTVYYSEYIHSVYSLSINIDFGSVKLNRFKTKNFLKLNLPKKDNTFNLLNYPKPNLLKTNKPFRKIPLKLTFQQYDSNLKECACLRICESLYCKQLVCLMFLCQV